MKKILQKEDEEQLHYLNLFKLSLKILEFCLQSIKEFKKLSISLFNDQLIILSVNLENNKQIGGRVYRTVLSQRAQFMCSKHKYNKNNIKQYKQGLIKFSNNMHVSLVLIDQNTICGNGTHNMI